MRDDLHIPMIGGEPGIQCGCGPMIAVCEEGKRLQERISASYRNCMGLYGRKIRSEAQAKWQEACEAYQQHLMANHRD